MKARTKNLLWNIVIGLGAVLFVVNSILFIRLGQVNTDEGWYLYASKLVYAGQLPYRDFAFTQTPLLPYIYGLAQRLFLPGITLGRVTSVAFSVAAFILALLIAANYGGKAASGLTAWLWATFSFGIYFQSITKTYALTTFFFLLTFFTLASHIKQETKLILAAAFVTLATLTRLSALFFAIPILLYAVLVGKTRTRLITTAIGLVALGWMLYLALPNPSAAVWGLLTYHTAHWGNIPTTQKILEIAISRIPRLFIVYGNYLVLAIVLLLMTRGKVKQSIRRFPIPLIVLAGLLLFVLPNLISGTFLEEYFVPLIFTALPIMGIALIMLLARLSIPKKVILNIAFLFALVWEFIWGGYFFIDRNNGITPIDAIKRVADVARENSEPQDQIFTLEALTVAVEADRPVPPNLAMASFSFSEADTKTANSLHLVNGELIADYFENGIPKVVVLTGQDWQIFRDSGIYEAISAPLERNYRLIFSEEGFGQHSDRVELYVSKNGN
jgi:hypothetical protein